MNPTGPPRARRWPRTPTGAGGVSSKRSKVHPKYKTKYRVKNWAAYDKAMVTRGDITLWIRVGDRAGVLDLKTVVPVNSQ